MCELCKYYSELCNTFWPKSSNLGTVKIHSQLSRQLRGFNKYRL